MLLPILHYALGMAKDRSGNAPTPKVAPTVRRVDGEDRWLLPSLVAGASGDAWVEIEIPGDDWPGYWFRVSFDGPELVGIEIHRSADSPALTRRKLQAVPLESIKQAARERITSWTQRWIESRSDAGRIAFYEAEVWLRAFEDQGRDPNRDRWLAEIAQTYVQTIGNPRQLHEIHDRHSVAVAYVPDIIREARDRGILSRTTRGKAGGELLPHAAFLCLQVCPRSILFGY